MIDLHLHTNASDGRYPPSELVARARAAGITTLSVTDHDTTAGLDEAASAADRTGMTFVPGIEITAVWRRKDVHVLGYYFDARCADLQAFLARQRLDRIRRFREMVVKVAALGLPVDPLNIDAIVEQAERRSHQSLGRPQLADALVAAGYVATRKDAFDRYLGDQCAAFVPRSGASPEDVVRIIAGAGGISSFAHPGLLARDELIEPMVGAGLHALEAYHSKHTPEVVDRYLRLAARYGLAVSGGSDFHGDEPGEFNVLGGVALPAPAFDGFRSRAARAVRPS